MRKRSKSRKPVSEVVLDPTVLEQLAAAIAPEALTQEEVDRLLLRVRDRIQAEAGVVLPLPPKKDP